MSEPVIYLDDPTSVEKALGEQWGTVAVNGVITQLCCPLCCALVPANYTNAHEVRTTPKQRHGDVHRGIARVLSQRKADA